MAQTARPLESNLKLGFFGAGQLARMTALQAFRYGLQVAAYSDRSENEPVQWMTPHTASSSFDDEESMIEFARGCDLITLENEFIDSALLARVRDASGTPIYPTPESFATIENKRIEKETFQSAGLDVTPWSVIDSPEKLDAFGESHGWPYLLKSSKGGYDGYGNRTVDGPDDAREAWSRLGADKGHEVIAEAFVDFTHELAVQVARNRTGSVVYPCCETIQENHICIAVRSPAPVPEAIQNEAQRMALKATEAIDGIGIFAYEFFLTKSGKLLINESAPRPHNSGHYTIEGCITSQFENHARAVLGWPLGSTGMRAPAVVMINLLGTDARPAIVEGAESILNESDAHLHIYGKIDSRPGRKMGHLTLLGDDSDSLLKKGVELAAPLRI
ncbi:MAG: 5-(carboxyamino)imidazole ribonucleotide synthase [Bacteroidota bacterium]